MILVLGASGYIGSVFLEQSQRCVGGTRKLWDYSKFSVLYDWLRKFKPQAVVNAAAYIGRPSIEANEKNRRETLRTNAVWVQSLVNACELTGTPLLHISTGCLYQGAKVEFGHEDLVKPNLMDDDVLDAWMRFPEKFRGWSEDDAPHLHFDARCGVYTGSKELAESVVRPYDKAWICRIRLPFDHVDHPRNYITKLLTYEKLVDQINSFSQRQEFVKACLQIIETGVPFGTYHLTNPGAIRTTQVVEMIMDHLPIKSWIRDVEGAKAKYWQYWNPISFAEAHPMPVSNCILDTSKAQAAGIKMTDVREAFEAALKGWVSTRC